MYKRRFLAFNSSSEIFSIFFAVENQLYWRDNVMKGFVMLFVVCISEGAFSQEVGSLSATSLLYSQLDFLEMMCLNRTESNSVFDKLKETILECESEMLNGTKLSFTYKWVASHNIDSDNKTWFMQ